MANSSALTGGAGAITAHIPPSTAPTISHASRYSSAPRRARVSQLTAARPSVADFHAAHDRVAAYHQALARILRAQRRLLDPAQDRRAFQLHAPVGGYLDGDATH